MKRFFFTGTFLLVVFAVAGLTMSLKTHHKTEKEDCVSYSFSAIENGVCVATMRLYSDCTYVYVNKEETPHQRVEGTYEMNGKIEKRGDSATIRIYANGEYQGYGTIAWPLQGSGIHLYFGDWDFVKD